ncbi:MAG: Mrp/NBP35 family ATP-binding protein [Alphaproteobacteria bacterium]
MKLAVLQKEIKEKIMGALGSVSDPGRGRDIVSLGMVSGLQVAADGNVIFMIEVDPARGAKLEPLRQEAERAAAGVPGVRKVTAVLTAQKISNDPHGMEKNPKLELPIKNIIAVASGKGGVGKSTVAMNLAIALARSGKTTGLLDADIYGPSVPTMAGLEGQRPKQNDDGRLVPLSAHGLKIMSIGFMLDKEAPLVWRGPMVQTAVYQMLRDVEWGTEENKLDILIVDMPPGTGDAQLTLAQKVPVTGAVIVSTPQDIALIDARKAVAMFQKVNVKILGIIENMSTHVCSNCGHEEHIFGHGGARKEAERLGVPFLGEIPLDASIRKNSDEGKPVAEEIFAKIAGLLTF